MTLTLATLPEGEAFSLDAARDYLRIGTDGEDALVTALPAPDFGAVDLVVIKGRACLPGVAAACCGDWR
tara:strand:+ start:149 stop:355 length:207 start_codon:yes stop_codon:yes gene_type:complete